MENSPPCDSLILCHRRMLPQLWPACRPFCVPDRSYRFPRDGSCRRSPHPTPPASPKRPARPASPPAPVPPPVSRVPFFLVSQAFRASWSVRSWSSPRTGRASAVSSFPTADGSTSSSVATSHDSGHRTRPRPPPCISAPRVLARGAACVGRRRARRSTRWTAPCPSDNPDTASCLPCNVRAGDSHRPPRISAHPCHEADARHAGWLARRPFTPRSRHHAFSDGSNGYPSS